jgi:molecular chaperone GrpE
LNDENETSKETFNEMFTEETNDVSEQLKKLTSENESLKDLMQRRQADFENYKKRMLKQFEDSRKYALKDIAEDIISVYDDLLRAIDAALAVTKESVNVETYASMLQGIEMVSKRIEEVLNKHGIVEIEALGCAFDPNMHEAYEIEFSDNVEQDTVSKVHQKGFKVDDVIVRTSKVKVAKPSKKD